MTTLTSLLQSTLTTLPNPRPHFSGSSTFASAPLEKKYNAHYDNPCFLPSSPSSSCTQLSLRILRCGFRSDGRIPGRSGRVAHTTVGGRGCHVCCSLSDDETHSDKPSSYEKSTSPTTTCTGEADRDKKSSSESQAMLPMAVSEAAARDAGFGDFSLLQTRRFWLGTSVGVLAALGGNLAGVTSSIFNLNPQVSRSFRADLLFPVKGFKRCLESSQGFEFIYPTSWVGDQRLLTRAIERGERERSLYLSPIEGRQARKQTSSRDPVVAFGPPGTDGELNVSVVVAPVYPGFTLQKIGGPQEAGELILKQFIAPEGSKKVAILLKAQQRMSEDQLYYTLEYSVKGSTFFRHNLSVYTTNAGKLYSLNAQTSESAWKAVQGDFAEMANSFKLLL